MEMSAIRQNENLISAKQSKNLLFVDDNPLVLETVKQLIDTSPYELLTKDDPFEGLCELVERKPALVFIDANMTKLNGYQFCALIKAQKNYQFIPLIIVLEFASKLEQAKAYAAGANAVLIKPFGKNELLKFCPLPGEQAA